MNDNSLLISVIIPVYNGERYLRQAIAGALGQQYRPLEIIVVDDGSLDGTAVVAASFGEAVHYVYQPNAGPGAARNRGVALAKGALFAFLDADDWWHPAKLERQMARLAQEPTLGYLLCHMQVVQEADAQWPVTLNQAHYQNEPPCHLPSALLVRRDIFAQVGSFDERYRYSDDTDWFLRAKDAGIPMAMVPEVLVYKRIHHTNLSHTPAMTQETLRAFRSSVQRQRQHISGRGEKTL